MEKKYNSIEKTLINAAKKVTKNKKTAINFLKSCEIMNERGELSENYK